MTLATLILDSLYAGLFLIAVGVVLDCLQANRRRRASRLRASDPFAAFEQWAVPAGPRFGRLPATSHEPSTWAS
jgi:hypothetical protein